MVLHICPMPGCALTSDECTDPAHTPGGWTPEEVRGTSTERGYGAAWRRKRRDVLARARHRCAICNGPASEVDHITPRSEAGDDTPGNLRALCRDCHKAKTTSEAARGRARRRGAR